MLIKLKEHKIFPWFEERNNYIRGFFWYNDTLYKESEAAIFIAKLNTEEMFYSILNSLNGNFAIIKIIDEKIYLAADKLRSFPIFYINEANKFVVSDDLKFLKNKFDCSINDDSLNEILAGRAVLSRNTIYSNVSSIEAGDFLKFNKSIEIKKYFCHNHINLITDENVLIDKFSAITNKVFQNLLKDINGKQVVVPLSSGYDSRFIVAMLKKMNYDNVICFSYGRQTSFEAVTSKKIASKLGYKWYFIEYSDEFWKKYISKMNFRYFFETSSGTALPAVQTAFAVNELRLKGLIDKNAIFLSGHGGDVLAGSDFIDRKVIEKKYKNLVNLILKMYFKYCDEDYFNKLKISIEKNINNSLTLESAYEEFIKRTFDSKYILNSVRSFEYYGFEWRVPLWDDAFKNFWYQIDNQFRKDKNFYKKFLNKFIFKSLDIEKLEKDKTLLSNLKNKFVLLLPFILKKYIKKILNKKEVYLNKRDFNNFLGAIKIMKNDVKIEFDKEDTFIPCFSKWFVFYLKNIKR